MSGRRTSVTVDRIVLRGVDPQHAAALAASLKAELARVLAQPSARGETVHAQQTHALRLGKIPLEPGRAGARAFGVRVARAIGKGVSR